MPKKINGHKTYISTLSCNGEGVYGDLTISGFATSKTAEDLSEAFAALLEDRWPGVKVLYTVKIDGTYLSEENGDGR